MSSQCSVVTLHKPDKRESYKYPGDNIIICVALYHRDKELETARPVDNEEHHAQQIEYLHENSDRFEKLKQEHVLDKSYLHLNQFNIFLWISDLKL